MNTIQRLQHFYSVINRVPPEQLTFDGPVQDTAKGTVADPLVWAALDYQFIKQGLHLEVVLGCSSYPFHPKRISLVPVFGEYQCLFAACLFFDLQDDEINSLFLASDLNKRVFLEKLTDVISKKMFAFQALPKF